MKVLKKGFNTIDWHKWKNKDRKEIDKIAPPWVNCEEQLTKKEETNKEKYNREDINYNQEEMDMNLDFKLEEMYRAIKATKEKSSPGRDNINCKMIKELTEVYVKELLKIFNWCYKNGRLMKEQKETQTIFIDKGDKEKVRPITLSSCMGKVLERMVNERLIWWAESQNILDKNQNGFRRGKSTVDNLAKIVADIEILFKSGEHTMAAYLDIASAYDNMIREILIDNLKKCECLVKIVTYVNEWIKDRNCMFVIGPEEVEYRQVKKGLPQGGVISSTLYAIYTRKITEGVEYQCKVLQYADDIAMYISGKKVKELANKLEKALVQINNNLLKIGLKLQPDKTQMVDYNKKGVIDRKVTMKFHNCEIRCQDSAKSLGIEIDSELKFKKQVEKVKKKVNKTVSVLKYVCRVLWGMEVNTALIMYKSYVRAIMDYALFVFSKRSQNKGTNRKITVQRNQSSFRIQKQYIYKCYDIRGKSLEYGRQVCQPEIYGLKLWDMKTRKQLQP